MQRINAAQQGSPPLTWQQCHFSSRPRACSHLFLPLRYPSAVLDSWRARTRKYSSLQITVSPCLFLLLYRFCDPAPQVASSRLPQQLRARTTGQGPRRLLRRRHAPHSQPQVPVSLSHQISHVDHKKPYLLRQHLKVLVQHTTCFAYDTKRIETFRQN